MAIRTGTRFLLGYVSTLIVGWCVIVRAISEFSVTLPQKEFPIIQSEKMFRGIKDYAVDVGIHCIWWFAHGLVLFGLALLIHEFLVAHGAISPIFVQWFLDLTGSILATLALLLVSISIYFENRGRRPPSRMSRKFSAPFMIGLSLLFLVVVLFSGSLSPQYIDALGAIALGGAMMRLTGVPLEF